MKFLPSQYYEELDPQYLDPNSKYFIDPEFLKEKPKIRDLIGQLTPEESEVLLDYMGQGKLIFGWMGMISDPLNPQNKVYTSEYSDGVWVWRDLHSYMVKNYRMDLPKEFKDYVFSLNGSVEHLKNLDVNALTQKITESRK